MASNAATRQMSVKEFYDEYLAPRGFDASARRGKGGHIFIWRHPDTNIKFTLAPSGGKHDQVSPSQLHYLQRDLRRADEQIRAIETRRARRERRVLKFAAREASEQRPEQRRAQYEQHQPERRPIMTIMTIETAAPATETALTPTSAAGAKVCLTCGEMRPLTDYQRNARRPDGLQLICRPCKRFTYQYQKLSHNWSYTPARYLDALRQKKLPIPSDFELPSNLRDTPIGRWYEEQVAAQRREAEARRRAADEREKRSMAEAEAKAAAAWEREKQRMAEAEARRRAAETFPRVFTPEVTDASPAIAAALDSTATVLARADAVDVEGDVMPADAADAADAADVATGSATVATSEWRQDEQDTISVYDDDDTITLDEWLAISADDTYAVFTCDSFVLARLDGAVLVMTRDGGPQQRFQDIDAVKWGLTLLAKQPLAKIRGRLYF